MTRFLLSFGSNQLHTLLQMDKQNYFSPKMAKKSDSQLRTIIGDAKVHAEEARLAAIWELEKRDQAVEGTAEVEAEIQERVAAKEREKQARKNNWKQAEGLPSTIKVSAILIYASIVLGILNMVAVAPLSNVRIELNTDAIVILVISYALTAYIGFMVGLGRSWARITYTVLCALGVLVTLPQLLLLLTVAPAMGSVSLLQNILQVGAVVLIFLKPSRAWYEASRETQP